MKQILAAAGFVCLLAAHARAQVAAQAAAQAPRVGDINFYGLRKVTPDKILAAAKVRSGGPLPASKGDMEDAVEKVPGVVLASVEAICCDGPDAVLFIGVEERGAPYASLRSEPTGTATLPPELLATYHDFLDAVARAAARGNVNEDLSAGHPLVDDPDARALQQRFLAFATDHTDWLRDVLRNAPDAGQRAIAAAVIGYAPHKKDILPDLQYAVQDPDPAVRTNAMHAIAAVGVYGQKHPAENLRVSPTWLVELLNSITLNDRIESAKALVVLTDARDASTLALIRERALPAVLEMARWKTLRYALPAFLLAGRIADMKEDEIQRAWARGDRESVLETAMPEGNKHR